MNFTFLNKPLFRSRIQSNQIESAEKIGGYLIGPVGTILVGSFLSSYLNVYYTDVLQIGDLWGGSLISLVPLVAQVFSLFLSVVMGQAIDKTNSAQGKARPWILVSAPLLAISTVLLFFMPPSGELAILVFMLATHLFRSVAATMYSLSHTLLLPLSTENPIEKKSLITFSNIAGMIPGFIIGVLFPGFILPKIGIDNDAWRILSCSIALIAFPLTLIEYYYTKERITSNRTARKDDLTLLQKCAVCCKNKNWLLFMLFVAVTALSSSLTSRGTFYYCNWVLGSYNDGITQLLFLAVGNAPYGFGVPLCNLACRKFSPRKVVAGGMVLAAAGTAICLLRPYSLLVVLFGQALKALGLIPSMFLMSAMLSDAMDSVEEGSGIRCDGFTSSAYNCIYILSSTAALCILNFGISALGYIVPGSVILPQPEAVRVFFTFCAIGCQLIACPIAVVLLANMKKQH